MVAESSEVSARSAVLILRTPCRRGGRVDGSARRKRTFEQVGGEILTRIPRSGTASDRFFTRWHENVLKHRAARNKHEARVARARPLLSSEVGFGFGQLRAI